MSLNKSHTFNSPRLQRAARINDIESARLNQILRYIDRAKVHQCRLANQDIKLISVSLEYIQSSSGHSPEARDPGPGLHGAPEKKEHIPCFMYGERIWSRTRKRWRRPVSASERSVPYYDSKYAAEEPTLSGEHHLGQNKNRTFSATRLRGHVRSEGENDLISMRELNQDKRMSGNHITTPRDQVTPRQVWEDDISEVTQKILTAQARAQSGKCKSVYQAPTDIIDSQASRKVSDLLRKIRISTMSVLSNEESYISSVANHIIKNQPLRRPQVCGETLAGKTSQSENHPRPVSETRR